MIRIVRRLRVRARLATAAGVVLVLLAASGSVALMTNRAQVETVAQLRTLGRLTDYVKDQRFWDADVSGWQAAYAWDSYRLGPERAIDPTSPNRAGFLADKQKLLAALGAAPLASMTPAERTANDVVVAKWTEFFASDDEAVQAYAAGDVRRAEDLIQNRSWVVYAELLDATAGLTDSVEQRAAAAQRLADERAADARLLILVALLVAAAGTVAILALIAHSITDPLRRILSELREVADGNLGVQLVAEGDDEFTDLGGALADAVAATRATVRDVVAASSTVAQMADALSTQAVTLTSGNRRTLDESHRAGTAADTISGDVAAIAGGAQQMGASIVEISVGMAQSSQVAREAVEAAEQTRSAVSELGAASEAIGAVVTAITSIAEQTNLLALNATIEAARAGEAGRGFAIVAGEVKELARETGAATEEITAKVAAVRSGSAEAAAAIGRIAEIIGRVDEFQASISTAVEEQTATTRELARRVTGAATGTEAISGMLVGVRAAADADRRSLALTAETVESLRATSTQLRSAAKSFRL